MGDLLGDLMGHHARPSSPAGSQRPGTVCGLQWRVARLAISARSATRVEAPDRNVTESLKMYLCLATE
jgi:hypothetical protein